MDEKKAEVTIFDTYLNLGMRLRQHSSIAVGVSGGSDSTIIVHMICKWYPDMLEKVHFVFENTGLEFKATLRQIDYLEERYGIEIARVRGEPIPVVVKREGIPILSKEFSETIRRASRGMPSALKKIQMSRKESRFALSDTQKALAHYLLDNDIKVSAKCCDLSKKKPHKAFLKSVNADLTISGERRAEGGLRATMHKGCFEDGKDKKVDKYMPLFYWDDETKDYYKEKENIRYSDCYEVWGMKRTGCVGCPFNSRAGEDLKLIKKYEPNMYKACICVFGKSYELMDEFNVHRHKIFEEQTSLFDKGEK